jgi:hypothetical protein
MSKQNKLIKELCPDGVEHGTAKETVGLNQETKHSVIADIKSIIDQGRRSAYNSIGSIMIDTYWKIGRRIVEEEQQGETRATYGAKLIQNLSNLLTPIYGTSYNKRNLDYYRKFYLLYSDLEIVNTCVHNLD